MVDRQNLVYWQNLVYSPVMTANQETDRVYSFSPKAIMGPDLELIQVQKNKEWLIYNMTLKDIQVSHVCLTYGISSLSKPGSSSKDKSRSVSESLAILTTV